MFNDQNEIFEKKRKEKTKIKMFTVTLSIKTKPTAQRKVYKLFFLFFLPSWIYKNHPLVVKGLFNIEFSRRIL